MVWELIKTRSRNLFFKKAIGMSQKHSNKVRAPHMCCTLGHALLALLQQRG